MRSDGERMTPGKKWYGLALSLFILGPLVGAFLLIHSIFMASKHSITFYIPGNSTIMVSQPGEYTLWMANQDPHAAHKVITDIQKMTINFIDNVTQKKVTFQPKAGWVSTGEHIAHYSLGTVNFGHRGTYSVAAASQRFTPYKVYLRQPGLVSIIRTLALSIFLAILGVVSGVLLAIIILIKRIGARNSMEKPLPPHSHPEPISSQETTWAMICHLSGFAGFLFPLANIIAPLLIWGFKRQEYPYVDDQGKEAINFQISIAIYYVIAAVLILIVIGLFLLPLIAAFHIIAMIIASVEAAHGKLFRYPLTIRFLK